jgi:hypothetical protein
MAWQLQVPGCFGEQGSSLESRWTTASAELDRVVLHIVFCGQHARLATTPMLEVKTAQQVGTTVQMHEINK